MTIYVADAAFKSLAEALAGLEPCPFAGRVTADQVMIALAEVGRIVPECSREQSQIDD